MAYAGSRILRLRDKLLSLGLSQFSSHVDSVAFICTSNFRTQELVEISIQENSRLQRRILASEFLPHLPQEVNTKSRFHTRLQYSGGLVSRLQDVQNASTFSPPSPPHHLSRNACSSISPHTSKRVRSRRTEILYLLHSTKRSLLRFQIR